MEPTISKMVRTLVRSRRIHPNLYQHALASAKHLLSMEYDARGYAPEDLTAGFLLDLYKKGNDLIQTKTILAQEMRSFFIRNCSPEAHELWTIISEALIYLEKGKKVRRFGGCTNRRNGNDTSWTSKGLAVDGQVLDVEDFMARAAKIEHFKPAKRKDPNRAKILSPQNARALVLKLLEAARGPIPMNLIVQEAQKHITMMGKLLADDSPSENEDNTGKDHMDQHADGILTGHARIVEETSARAARIWEKACSSGERRLLCRYFLPKYFFGKKVKLDDGEQSSSTAFDKVAVIRKIMASEMAVERLAGERADDIEGLATEMAGTIAAKLFEKCSEEGFTCGFI